MVKIDSPYRWQIGPGWELAPALVSRIPQLRHRQRNRKPFAGCDLLHKKTRLPSRQSGSKIVIMLALPQVAFEAQREQPSSGSALAYKDPQQGYRGTLLARCLAQST